MEYSENFQESPLTYRNRSLHQEKIKIDGRKLKQMLNDNNETTSPGCLFFNKIMRDTNTNIIWPNKNALETKWKKDAYVEVCGSQEDIVTAKELILKLLPVKNDRITMKMDISYTDHSHIIGKSGLSIKRVMEETQCHVHFPDSNRYNSTKKSNQVSISGDLECVELARLQLRKMIPLIFGFEPSIFGQIIDNKDEYLQEIQENYNVQVMFKTRSKLNATIVLVKGDEWELERVQEATIKLMEYICKDSIEEIPIQMSLQISPQYHQIVLGRNHINLKTIMQYTNTKILVPDAHDENISNLKKNNINISGNINNVYIARQLLMGNLPLQILFELPIDIINNINQNHLNDIQIIYNVSINIFQRNKQNGKTCLIKGIEREAANIYKARDFILGNDELPIMTQKSTNLENSQQEPLLSPQNTSKNWINPSTVCGYHTKSLNNNCDNWPNFNHPTISIVEEPHKNPSSSWTDITSLLNSIGLEQYVMLFVQEEIDLEIFSTLNDNDLITIGISTFDNRQRMLMAIIELNKQLKSFSLAPGAERKKSFKNMFR